MDKAKTFYRKISGAASNPSCCPDLDLKTRIIGFILSFIVGIFMMISSISQLFTLALGGQRYFAIWYTCGNIVCLSSTFFLMGPKKQCENMMKPERKLTSLVLFSSMAACLIMAFSGVSKLIVLIAIVIQFMSLVWYVLSYIPGGQRLCSGCIRRTVTGKTDGSYTEMV